MARKVSAIGNEDPSFSRLLMTVRGFARRWQRSRAHSICWFRWCLRGHAIQQLVEMRRTVLAARLLPDSMFRAALLYIRLLTMRLLQSVQTCDQRQLDRSRGKWVPVSRVGLELRASGLWRKEGNISQHFNYD